MVQSGAQNTNDLREEFQDVIHDGYA